MNYYHYQCDDCSTTLQADYLPDVESYTYVRNGLCSSCEGRRKHEEILDYDEDYYYHD